MAFFVKKHKSCCGCISLKTGTMIILWLFVIKIPDSFEELKLQASSKLGCSVVKIFTAQGCEIEDIDIVKDDESLYVSAGEAFIEGNMQKSMHTSSTREQSDLVTSVFQLHGDIDSLYDFHDYVSNFKIKTTFSAFVEWTFWSMIIFALLFNLIPYVSAMYGAYMRKAAYLQPFILLNAVSIVNLISVLVFVVITFVIVCVNRPGLENDITEFLKENPQISKDYSIPNDASATILTAILTACIIVFAMISVSTVILYHFTCVVHSYYLKLKEEKEDYKYNMFRSPSEKKEPLA